MKPPNSSAILLAAALVASGTPGYVGAQASPGRTSGLRGSVVDARSGAPLEGATVSLEMSPAGLVARERGGVPGLLVTMRRSITSGDGAYAFQGLATGTYRVRVVRIGYRPAILDVHYDGPADPRVSIGLEVSPVELEPVDVVTRRPQPLTAGAGAGRPRDEDERVRLERLRQDRYLTPDSRVLTDADVVEAVTLGETDLLRALHHLPGVSAEDDWSAEPWTRGSRWDETRIYFDGLPLLDPMHLGGAFTSVNPDAVGSLTFHPGVHPVDAGEAAVGLVDLRSRPATGEEHLSALGQLSVLSARFSADRPYGDGSGITVSGRRSLLEDLTRWDEDRRGSAYIPYRFTDLMGRWDQVLGDSLKLEVSALESRDRVLGDLPNELKGARGTWGNTLFRVTAQSTSFGLRTRLTRGRSTFVSDIDVVPFDPGRGDLTHAATAAPTFNRVRSDVTELTTAPLARSGVAPSWEVGVRRVSTAVEYRGPAPWPYPGAANAGTSSLLSDVDRTSLWGQVREPIAPDVEVAAGIRLEFPGLGSATGASVEAAPRITVAWRPTPDLRVSVAAGRHHQYEQALAAAGFTIGPALVPGHLWVSAKGEIPPIRSDVVTAGGEMWLPGGWLASANIYARLGSGRITPAPDSGDVRARPPVVGSALGPGWVAGTNATTGIEVGVRKLVGRWTGSLAYSLSRGRTTAAGRSYATPGERTHLLDAGAVFSANPRTRIGAGFTAATGAAYTRFYAFRCTDVTWYCPEVDGDALPVIGFAEPAGGVRTPAYVSLDLHVERSGTLFGLPVGFYAQLRNALGRHNSAAYLGSVLTCDDDARNCSLEDRFEDGFPFLPLVGLWIRM